MRIKYFIITKVGIKTKKFDGNDIYWDEWLNNSLYLHNRFCRPSVKNQTNQDFTLLSFYDESIKNYGEILHNEEILFAKRIDDIINSINDRLDGYDYAITTILDRDDCLKKDFVDIVRKNLKPDIMIDKKYIDLYSTYVYDYINKKMHSGNNYPLATSPFVTVMEKIIDKKITGSRFLIKHGLIKDNMVGEKLKNLSALQIIHGHNIINKVKGNIIDINSDNFYNYTPGGFEIK